MSHSPENKTDATDHDAQRPWYRQFWFWFVFGPLIFIIIMCGFTVSIALKNADDVVIDNYYKEGRMINQTLDQDKRARELGLIALVKFDLDTNKVTLSFDHPRMDGKSHPDVLLLNMGNPVKAALDQMIVLHKKSANQYEGVLMSRPEYNWYLTLYSTDKWAERNSAEWTLSGQIHFSAKWDAWLKPRVQ
jgi:uncharacterized protein